MTTFRSGSCNCGAVRFHIDGPLRDVIFCHCSQCRKQSGHYFAATSVDNSRLRIEGGDGLTWYAASETALRGFCRVCGSTLFWRQNRSGTTSILAGAFDEPSGLKGGYHIFVAEKGNYYSIDDDLLKYPQDSPQKY